MDNTRVQMWVSFKKNDLLNTIQKVIKDSSRVTIFKDHKPGNIRLTLFLKIDWKAENISNTRADVRKDSNKRLGFWS